MIEMLVRVIDIVSRRVQPFSYLSVQISPMLSESTILRKARHLLAEKIKLTLSDINLLLIKSHLDISSHANWITYQV